MADLHKLFESLKINEAHPKSSIQKGSPSRGQKRRNWIEPETTERNEENQEDSTHQGASETPISITVKGVDQTGLSTPLANRVDQLVLLTPSINPIDQPHKVKGTVEGVDQPLLLSLSQLRGNPLKVLQYLFENLESPTGRITDNITRSSTAINLQISIDSVRTATKFLVKNTIVFKNTITRGKQGSVKYELSNSVYNELMNCYQKGLITPLRKSGSLPQNKGSIISSSSNLLNTTTTLPDDWSKIDLTQIKAALEALPLKTQQFLGYAELKKIHKNASDKLTALQVEESLNEFAYGLQNHIDEEPYASMKNPGAIIYNKLLNGDIWVEKRFLTPIEQRFKNTYMNISKKLDSDIDNHFQEWLSTDRKEKYDYYRSKLPSNYYYSDKEFMELAYEDFRTTIWLDHKKKVIIDYMGIENLELIEKLTYSELKK